MDLEWHRNEPYKLSRGYKRDPVVEEQICSWIKLSKKEILYYARLKDKKNVNYPRIETLIHFTRRAIRNGDNSVKDILLTEIFNKGRIIIWNIVKRHCDLEQSQVEDVAYDALHDMIVNIMDLTDKHEFWEANFLSCVRKLISTKLEKYIKRRRVEFHPFQYERSDGSSTDTSIENEAIDNRNPEDIVISKMLYERLTPPHDKILYLLTQGYNQEEMAEIIGCSSRTIRNYLQSIRTIIQV